MQQNDVVDFSSSLESRDEIVPELAGLFIPRLENSNIKTNITNLKQSYVSKTFVIIVHTGERNCTGFGLLWNCSEGIIL